MKKIIIAGNLGYVGIVLTTFLVKKYRIIGIDTGYFKTFYIRKKEIKNYI